MTNSGQDMSGFSMLELFHMEVDCQVAILNENLLALESKLQDEEPTAKLGRTELESLMRAAHSIKGAARIVDIEAVVKVAHALEDCFAAALEDSLSFNLEQVDLLLTGVDFLSNIAECRGEGPSTSEVELKEFLATEEDIDQLVKNLALILESEQLVVRGVEQRRDSSLTKVEPSKEIAPQEESSPGGSRDEGSLAPTPVEETTSIEKSPTTIPVEPLPPENSEPRQTKDRIVRVSAESLNRLMGLAGEALVEANWLEPFADSLLDLKAQQRQVEKRLEKLEESLLGAKELPLVSGVKEQIKLIRQQEQQCQELLSDRLQELEQFSRRSANLSDSLYREVIASHMRPFADGVSGFHRMVRDLAKTIGKQVKLEVVGKSTQVDRDILEKLEAPLTHILRNAVDHGIESPAERLAKGKPTTGNIVMDARHRSGMLSIQISDDGRGINLVQLRQRIVAKGLVNAATVTQLTESELLEFLFLPGFSTTAEVTELSGRGVGLDIAKSMADEVGGTVRANTHFGRGTSFHFQLPLTLSVIRTLLVEISQEPYAFPLTRINKILMIEQEEIATVENRQYISLDGENIGLLAAHQVLELPASDFVGDLLPVIIISDQLNRYGLVVDHFLGESNLVVRPLDSRLGKVRDISAAAIREDGSPVLIVDVPDLVRSIDNILASKQLSQVNNRHNEQVKVAKKRILVVDDSITVREMERKLLENQGYQVDVAVNGMEGWNAVRTEPYDLVISDIDMPRMNGIELVSNIKGHTKLRITPVIIVSYKDREEDRIRGLEAGADYYLTKSSFHDDTLLNAVVDLIGN